MVSGSMSCVKYLLFVFNLLFAISGIAILTVGAIIQGVYSDYSTFVRDEFFTAPIILIVVGVIIFVVAFFGCCGAVRENHCMIITFSVFLVLIFILELSGGIAGYLLRDDVKSMLNDRLNTTMLQYGSPKHPEATKGWNVIQFDLHCCGMKDYNDWQAVFHNETLPSTCCPTIATGDECTIRSDNKSTNGCLPIFTQKLERNAVVIGGVGIGVACVQLLGVIFACCLARSIRREYETV